MFEGTQHQFHGPGQVSCTTLPRPNPTHSLVSCATMPRPGPTYSLELKPPVHCDGIPRGLVKVLLDADEKKAVFSNEEDASRTRMPK